MPRLGIAAAVVLALSSFAFAEPPTTSPYFAIHVIDAQTGRGVPLAWAETTYRTRYYTDSNGYIAFNEPGLMNGEDVWFDVRSFGYEPLPGAFGTNGVALKPKPGASADVKLKRTNLAERLYRMTGYGIYRDSVLLGLKPPIADPLLNAQVTGQDTVQVAVYRGKYLWLWGDTGRLGFPLGNFFTTGATATKLPADIDVDRGIDFQYFAEKPGGFTKPMAHVPREGTNPIWLDGLVATHDRDGRERLIGRYFAANPDFSSAEGGLVIYDDATDRFERLVRYPGDGAKSLGPSGDPFRFIEGGKRYYGFGDGVRVEDTCESASDPTAYEVFTCLKEDSTIDRDANGKVRWHWQRNGERLDQKKLDTLVKEGSLKREELPWQFVDVETNKSIRMANGSLAYNEHLKRWIMIFTQADGASPLGEVWFSTANSPFGPWRAARKVATHAMKDNNNSFYNPVMHEELARGDGRFIVFEGTFVTTFSGNEHPTPYYDYNNIMYRLDLDDPRLKLPEPPPGLIEVEPLIGR